MIEHINDTTIKLTPDASTKCGCNKPTKKLNWLEAEISKAVKSAIRSDVEKQAWLKRQLRRVAVYEAALETR